MSMPAVFVGHGSPMNTIENNRYTDSWRRLGASLPRPNGILAISAHWFTRGTSVTAMDRPRTIHDFSGFPPELYAVSYPAPGDPALAARVHELLAPVDVKPDTSWGLDHGTWSVLVHVFPDADIPVVQLSMDATQAPAWHFALAKRLAPLREEGVLILGSGNVVHNLGLIQWSEDARPYEWATRFSRLVRDRLSEGRQDALVAYESLDADAPLSVPTLDHYLPLLYVAAQCQADDEVSFPVDGIEYGSIGMLAMVVGTPRFAREV